MTHASLHDQLRARARELMGDGKWHNYEQMIRELSKLIPPGVAMRRQETGRIKSRVKPRGPGERVLKRDLDRMVESGRRDIVRVFFKNPAFEKDMHGDPAHRLPERRIRLTGTLRGQERNPAN